jgi:outer membrane protein OmpA-like peptidoglycan-associated protein
MSKLVLFFSALISIPLISNAQVDSTALSQEYYDMGMEVYDFLHRRQAKDLFVQSAEYDPKNAKAHLMAGKTIMLTVHKEEALKYFLDSWVLEPDLDEDILYWIGQAYQHSEKFDSAIVFYEQFNRVLARSMRFQRSLKINEVNRKIFECRNAKIFKYYPVDVEITNLSENINSEWPEYAPTITADESMMVFTSRRPDNVNPTVAEDLDYFEDIYISRKVDGKWSYAKNLGPPLNTLYHNASINLAPDGSEMFIYSDEDGGDIYESFYNKEDQTWSDPKPLKGEVNTEYLENSATVTADGTKLFFTSDRPGGYGGTDIYMAERSKSGAWLNPKNVGPDVNTEYNEDGAFISANGNHLYFSSFGHAGMGDMDIYRAAYNSETEKWEESLNLGYPINSVENDIYFVLTGDERYAYYSSVKGVSKGEQDIYRVDMKNWEPTDLSQPAFIESWIQEDEKKAEAALIVPAVIKLQYEVVDETTLSPIPAKVALISEEDRVLSPTSTEDGKYTFEFTNIDNSNYEVRITKEGYLPHVSKIYILGTADKQHEVTDKIILKRARKSYSAVLNVYFGLDSDIPNTFEDIQYVEMLMNGTPSIKLEISGHTDNSGSDEYNLNLSQRRADAVKKYLVETGIAEDRIIAKGYGEEKPVADNINRQGRRLNRRTEFKILEE